MDAEHSSLNEGLYRAEAVAHVNTRHYGNVLIVQPASHVLLAIMFSGVAISLIAFLFFFETTRKVACQGVVIPRSGVIDIVAPREGIIKDIRVREGDIVREGDLLFVLSNERSSSAALDASETISGLLQTRERSLQQDIGNLNAQYQLRVDALQKKIEGLKADRRRLAMQIELQKQQVGLTEATNKRYSQLSQASFISPIQLQEKESQLIEQRQKLNDLEGLSANVERDLVAAQSDISEQQTQAKRDREASLRNIAQLRQELTENETRREIFVRAPKNGTVTAITVSPGRSISSAQVLTALLPSESVLQAEIYAPSRAVGFIRPGMTVMVRYQAFPYQKFGQYRATVREIPSTSLRTEQLALPGAVLETAEPLYRIRLDLESQAVLAYGEQIRLRSGMLVEGSVILERRRLYEWILDPLYSISGRL